jgi:hypothetical protein
LDLKIGCTLVLVAKFNWCLPQNISRPKVSNTTNYTFPPWPKNIFVPQSFKHCKLFSLYGANAPPPTIPPPPGTPSPTHKSSSGKLQTPISPPRQPPCRNITAAHPRATHRTFEQDSPHRPIYWSRFSCGLGHRTGSSSPMATALDQLHQLHRALHWIYITDSLVHRTKESSTATDLLHRHRQRPQPYRSHHSIMQCKGSTSLCPSCTSPVALH